MRWLVHIKLTLLGCDWGKRNDIDDQVNKHEKRWSDKETRKTGDLKKKKERQARLQKNILKNHLKQKKKKKKTMLM